MTVIEQAEVAILEGHSGWVQAVAADDRYVYSGSADGTVRVWSKEDWKKVAVLEGHSKLIQVVAVDDRYVYSGSADGTVRVWSKEDWKKVAVLEGHSFGILALAVDDQYVYSGSHDKTVLVWRKADWSEVAILEGHLDSVWALAVDNRYVYSGSDDETVRIWSKEDEWKEMAVLEGHSKPVQAMVVDDRYVYFGSVDHTVRVWSKDDWKETAVLEGHSDWIWALAADDQYIYSGSDDYTVGIWSKDDWKQVAVLKGHSKPVQAVAVDDCYVYSGSLDHTVRVWARVERPRSMEKVVAREQAADRLEEAGQSTRAQEHYERLARGLELMNPEDIGLTEDDLEAILLRIRFKRELSVFMARASTLESQLEELEGLTGRVEETPVKDLEAQSEVLQSDFQEGLAELEEQTTELGLYRQRGELKVKALKMHFEMTWTTLQKAIEVKRDAIVDGLRAGGSIAAHDDATLRDIETVTELQVRSLESMTDERAAAELRRDLQETLLMGITIAKEHGWDDRESRLREQLGQLREGPQG